MENKKKTYTLELTAEELDEHLVKGYTLSAIDRRLDELKMQAKSDREQADLRLPWGVKTNGTRFYVQGSNAAECNICVASEAAAKLMSAAPELLEAVRAWMKRYEDLSGEVPWDPEAYHCVGLSTRALRKVETGVPE